MSPEFVRELVRFSFLGVAGPFGANADGSHRDGTQLMLVSENSRVWSERTSMWKLPRGVSGEVGAAIKKYGVLANTENSAANSPLKRDLVIGSSNLNFQTCSRGSGFCIRFDATSQTRTSVSSSLLKLNRA